MCLKPRLWLNLLDTVVWLVPPNKVSLWYLIYCSQRGMSSSLLSLLRTNTLLIFNVTYGNSLPVPA